MKKMRVSFLYLIGIAMSIFIIGCENSNITKHSEQPEDQEWFSVIDEWNENAELTDEEEAVLRERIETAMKIKQEGLPEEITQAWSKMKEDYKEFLGVDKLPRREIASGTYSWIPEEYLEGEKQKELYGFLSDRFKNLNQLYYKHGLRNSKNKTKQIGGYDYDTFLSVFGTGSNQVQWGVQAWTESDKIVDFLALDGQIRRGGVWFDDYNPTAFNWWWVEAIEWGDEYASSMVCFSAETIHTAIHNGSMELIPQPITNDYDCAFPSP